MSYNKNYRSGKLTINGGAVNRVWFEVDGKRAALQSREYTLNIHNIDQSAWSDRDVFDSQTAEYFEINPAITCEISYTATLKT